MTQVGDVLAVNERRGARYLPILKSRQGEMRALTELDDQALTEDLLPVIEFVEVDFESMDSDETALALRKLVEKITKAWTAGRPRCVIDTFAIELDTEQPAHDIHGEPFERDPITPTLLTLFHEVGLRVVPTIRLSDQERYVRGIADVMHGAKERGACLRIGGEDLDDTVVPLETAVAGLLESYDFRAADVDLLFDFGAINDDETVATTARLARFLLPALDQMPWRTFAVAAGGFPVDLSEVSAYSIAEIPRRDQQLWVRLSNTTRLSRGIDYADYAVTHPRLQTGIAFAAPPQIRYTTKGAWLVSKGRRNDRRGHRQFFDLCGRLRSERGDDVAPAVASWGDQEFHTAADKANSDGDLPGNASTWRAIATSHHIAFVRNSLRLRGEP